ncbi:ribonuclease Y [Candidatus Gottesmanbacteria bacterium RIFCSPLOWO2_01_FULL_49_10]|uniref:Ribonuclease Y n=1 Tax=Candidatus Gottesmanbacteria bacterium RIFCSPLOWO2_01_FULL_49_10 TaxID=1798396 RepID=A0A1F6B124_9BACT|nr:MAG: ribonuclease Y [Candidatus Gottesmanbacteria bacterium RIFCSPLOWO2_01_FULL_49_10]
MHRKSEGIDRREGALDEREKHVIRGEEEMKARLGEIEKIRQEELSKLEHVAHLTREEAKEIILGDIRSKLTEDIAKEIREAQARAHEESEVKAREILVDAMRHGATDYVAEYTVSVVKIKDEDVKGRIIGKEGRNIRAFETATGVDVDLDEEGIIRLSSFDPVRREIARVALERLMRDGRVQPGRIEEVVEIVKKEIDRIIFEEGQKLAHGVGVYNLPAPIVALLGRFKYRFSYGQNMIAHTLEETKIGIALAGEVGADVNVVRLGCLLHDIGKVITDQEGSHVELGVQLLKKYAMPAKVIDCVAQHHEDSPFSSVDAVLVYIADAISGSRPGARYENYEEYIKRLTDLEDIAKTKNGVKEVYAFQAGRELRVIVDPGKIDDATATILSTEIKEEIEQKLTFPGQIKVTVVRELRVTEIAK